MLSQLKRGYMWDGKKERKKDERDLLTLPYQKHDRHIHSAFFWNKLISLKSKVFIKKNIVNKYKNYLK